LLGSAGWRTLLAFSPKIRVYTDANGESKGVLGSFGKTRMSHRIFIFVGGQRRLMMGSFVLLGTWAGCGSQDRGAGSFEYSLRPRVSLLKTNDFWVRLVERVCRKLAPDWVTYPH